MSCKKKKLHKQLMLDALGDFEHMMLDQEVWRMALQIVDYILKTLHPCPSPKSMKEVMEKVLSHPRLNHCLHDKILPTHLAIAQHVFSKFLCAWRYNLDCKLDLNVCIEGIL
jgi:hypothetical protein